MSKTEVILVDKKDEAMGRGEKMWTHKKGKLHRAFSIFLFNSKGEMLLQRRAKAKYHSGGLWTNACCSHPRPGKNLDKEARRRLREEMGISCPLKEVFSFIYKANLGELTEHEFDHVFIGNHNKQPRPNKEEADSWRWIRPEKLKKDVRENPRKYTAWFKIIFKKVLEENITNLSFPLDKIYRDLRSKHGFPRGQWGLWCKRMKTLKDREEVVIGAVLTQNTNWKNVELAISNLKKNKACSLKVILKMKNLEELIRPSGFYKQKAGYLANLARFILKKYRGLERMKKADTSVLRKQLLGIKGIGPETADSILLYALDKPVFVIDEYTRRLVRRHRLSKNLSYDHLQKLFERSLKKDFRFYQDFHALIVIDGKSLK